MVSTPAIRLHNVSKRYGQRLAVADLNLLLAPGEVLGFLGPNGAGKTTTIRLLTGFLRPSAGSIEILGQPLHSAAGLALRQELGFVPDVAGLDLSIAGLRLLDDLAQLQRRPPVDRARLCTALDLDPHDLRRPLGALSRGTRQKVNLIQGLQHRPRLVILDEPTEGLDPLSKQALFDVLRSARDHGTTIFFSSHVLSEVEALCDQVALIRRGRLIAVDRVADLRQQLERSVRLVVATTEPAAIERQLAVLPGVTRLRSHAGGWEFGLRELAPLLALLPSLIVTDLAIQPASLADIFLHHYQAEDGAND